jgi:hypothetical protein
VKRSWLRAALLLLASAPLVVGVWALLVPCSFYTTTSRCRAGTGSRL